MSMIGTDDQQDVVAGPASPVHGIDHHGGVAVRLAQHGMVFRRAEWGVVLDVVGLAQPQHGKRRVANAQRIRDEALRHGPIAWRIQRDIQRLGGSTRPGVTDPARW